MLNKKEAIEAATRDEWRELGFYFDYDESSKTLNIHGDRTGLTKFSSLLLAYTSNPSNAELSEHDHMGPYMSLEIRTGKALKIHESCIEGTIDDFRMLSQFLEDQLSHSDSGQSFSFRNEDDASSSLLCFHLHPNGFDASSLDCMDWLKNIEE